MGYLGHYARTVAGLRVSAHRASMHQAFQYFYAVLHYFVFADGIYVGYKSHSASVVFVY